MKEKGFDVVMISADGKEVQELKEQEDCPHFVVPFVRTIKPWQDLKCLFKLIQLFRKLKPDIVHTHTPKAGLLGMLAAFICGVPVRLHTIAGIPWINYTGIQKRLLKFLEKLNIQMATVVYPNSNNLKQFLLQQGISHGKLKILGHGTSNGIDTDYFRRGIEPVEEKAVELLRKRAIKQDAAVWVYVGRLVKDKGTEELLDAFVSLKQFYPDDELWLIGEEEPELDPLSEHHLNIMINNSSIVRWGFQTDVRPFLAASGLLVFPSHREGFPNVPLQAAAMECAMILSDINGCNEIVTDSINGLLVPVANKQALYNAMLKMRNDADLRNYFSSNARAKVVVYYERQRIWDALLNEYCYWLMHKQLELPKFTLHHS
ncbi:MAG: glycosyltransferase family 4 protein [Chitinophagaceae bacterium]|nr:glycosyltransferase family 4 protein [Chitinophagaceae bacterium]